MSKTLIDISNELAEFDAFLAEYDNDLDNPEVIEKLKAIEDSIMDDFENKADNYAALIKTMMYRSQARKEESKRLAERAKIDENNAKRLAERLKYVMQSNDIGKVETKRYTLNLCKAGGKQGLEVDEDKVDTSYFIEQVISKLDKDRIRADIDNGIDVAGAKFKEREIKLRIK